jgi:hypothetical protein
MSADEISEQVLYDPREKLFVSKTGRSMCRGAVCSLRPVARGGVWHVHFATTCSPSTLNCKR